jgi:hypothetical protein
MIWIRASLPRFRYDQLMGFGWKGLLPIAVLNFLVTAVLIVMAEEGHVCAAAGTIRGSSFYRLGCEPGDRFAGASPVFVDCSLSPGPD